MEEMLKLLPVLIGLGAGFFLRRIGLLQQRDGESVFKLVFYLFVPAVTFTALSTVELKPRFAIYPAAAVLMIAAGYAASRFIAGKARLDPIQIAVFVSGGTVVNTAFQLPFAQLVYGTEGVASIAAFDLVNTVATFTLAYLVAIRGNPAHSAGPLPLDRLAKNPALYAIALGLLVNLTDLAVPPVIAEPVALFGSASAVLIPVGVGVLFDPLGKGLGKAMLMVTTRLVTGLAVAMALVLVLGLSGIDRTMLLLIGAAPVVFAVVAFASLEGLDVRLATNALSLSLMISAGLSLLIIATTA